MVKYLIPCIYMYKGRAVTGFGQKNAFGSGNLSEIAMKYNEKGADKILIFDFSKNDADHEEAISSIRSICEVSRIPVMAAGNVKRVEDVKKLLYAGCSRVVLNGAKSENMDFLPEVSKRFGKDKIAVSISSVKEFSPNAEKINEYASEILLLDNIEDTLGSMTDVPILLHTNHGKEDRILGLLGKDCVHAVSGSYVSLPDLDLNALKEKGLSLGIPVNVLKSVLDWSDFKKDADGLVPCIVQDYKNDEVLMMAYMNEESFKKTLTTGCMTYFLRSRQSLWVKGETSGHFQYVKSLAIDCDRDTMLAKVLQVGAACHTGNRSCFYTELTRSEYTEKNPLHVFQSVYNVILDRKKNPKEGSYTNYLFDKGIDKILKKVGEENTEIIIAAKNPDPEEIKYEISDYLYHLMVLMAERGVTWEEIIEELARR